MFVRSTAVALIITTAVAAVSISSSAAADRGHTAAQDAMDVMVVEDALPGAVGQAEDSAGEWAGSSGVADTATHRPRAAHDRFRIGSLTKPFLAVVVLQLAAEDKLDLDAPVAELLPGAPMGTGYDPSRITVRQLLSHTSGMSDFTENPAVQHTYLSQEFLRVRYATHRPLDLVRAATSRPPDATSGTAWHYSNTNYVVAGMIVEEVTGRSYATEIERRIVHPLGLSETSLPGTSSRIPGRHGRAYSTLFAQRTDGAQTADAPDATGPPGTSQGSGTPAVGAPVHDVTTLNPSLAGASGEMISSTGDLVRFFQALLNGRLLPPAQLREMKRTVPADDGSAYGLGLARRTLSCGTTVWGHDGAIYGSRSIAVTTPDGSHTAAFNLNGDWAGDPLKLVEAEYCG